MVGIVLRDISKTFGDAPVLRGVSLEIEPAEFLTLVGPSGCGKSTLLRILAGLESPSAGTVEIGRADVTGVRPAQRNLAMVFQSYALYPHLSVAENMLTPLKLRDLSRLDRLPLIGPALSRSRRRDLMKQVSEAAEILQITELLGRKPGQLSGGQRQRVALGRAMVRRPRAFLMDEPLSNLDAALRVHMRAELTALHKMLNTTFIYVTHDQAEALTMSTRIAVMMEGRLQQVGTPDEVYHQPANLKVAGFIGSPRINTLPAEVDGAGRVRVAGRDARVTSAARGPVSLGVRPEHVTPCPQDRALLSGRMIYRENLGSDVFVHLGFADDLPPVILRLTPAVAATLAEGAELHVTADPVHLLVFDQAGNRVASALPERTQVRA